MRACVAILKPSHSRNHLTYCPHTCLISTLIERGFTSKEFVHQNAKCPVVNHLSIRSLIDDFRGQVLEHTTICSLAGDLSVLFKTAVKDALMMCTNPPTKICNPNLPVSTKKDVLRLDIMMDNMSVMHVHKNICYLFNILETISHSSDKCSKKFTLLACSPKKCLHFASWSINEPPTASSSIK